MKHGFRLLSPSDHPTCNYFLHSKREAYLNVIFFSLVASTCEYPLEYSNGPFNLSQGFMKIYRNKFYRYAEQSGAFPIGFSTIFF